MDRHQCAVIFKKFEFSFIYFSTLIHQVKHVLEINYTKTKAFISANNNDVPHLGLGNYIRLTKTFLIQKYCLEKYV